MKTVEVICDQCSKDLTSTGNSVAYRLLVAPEHIPTVGGFVTSMMKYPPLERSHHFCGLPCFAAWINEKMPNLLEQYEKQQKHRKWLDEQRQNTEGE